MKFAHIYPVANQECYKQESYVMILAHLLKYYKKENFLPEAYVICDNGLYEEAQVSTGLQDVVDMIEASDVGSRVDEIIIPDTMNDIKDTIRLFEANKDVVAKYTGKYNFMFVSQATTLDELSYGINYINQYKDELPNLTVGISKLSPLARDSKELVDILKTCAYPIHMLGLKLGFDEMIAAQDVIRGCDSSQLAYIVKNCEEAPADFLHFRRDGRRADGRGTEKDIELETDVLDSDKLVAFRKLAEANISNEIKLD